MEQTKLERLLISEISGVDEPANQLDGWMVTKSVDGGEPVTAPEGVEFEEHTSEPVSESNDSIVAKIKGILLGTPGKDIDMEKTELVAILAESNEALAKSLGEAVTEALAKSVVPAEGEEQPTVEATIEEPVATLTAEDVAKAVSEAVEEATVKSNEIFEAILGRIEGIETALGMVARKSLDGQEGGTEEPVEKATPKLADAIESAFARGRR